MDSKEYSVLEHIADLRGRIIAVCVMWASFFVIAFLFSDCLIALVLDDLAGLGFHVVTLAPLEHIMTKLRLSFYLGFALALPGLLYTMIEFAKPGLKRDEVKALGLIFPSILLLFSCGAVIAYLTLLRLAFIYLSMPAVSIGLVNLWSLAEVMDFVLLTCLFVGLLFLTPIFALVLGRLGILSRECLKGRRRIIYLTVFAIAAILTPSPDAVTQIALALPIIAMIEISRLFLPRT